MIKSYDNYAKVFKAFCDETRLKVLDILQQGERCACTLLDEVSVSQPTLSHHMKILVESGIVVSHKSGKWIHYSINKNGLQHAIDLLKSIYDYQPTHTEDLCEKCS